MITMENKSQPLSPHLQVYRWHISSLLSISHRIVGVINFFCIIFVLSLLIFIQGNNQILQFFSETFFGKFFVISLCWSFTRLLPRGSPRRQGVLHWHVPRARWRLLERPRY